MFSSSSIFIPTALLPVHPGPDLPGFDFFYYQPPFTTSMSSILPIHTPGTLLYNRGGDDLSNKSLIYTAVLSTYTPTTTSGTTVTAGGAVGIRGGGRRRNSDVMTTNNVYTNLVFTQDLDSVRPEGVKIERVNFEVVEQSNGNDGTNKFLTIDGKSEWSVCDDTVVWGRWDWMREELCEAVNIVVEE